MQEKDSLQRFVIESAAVRGACVSLDDAWAEARGRVQYPAPVQQVLGHAFAAATLLATTIKFEGKLTLQIRGDGPIHLLVVQITAGHKLRGLARWSTVPDGQSLAALFGTDARMTITIEAKAAAEPYQGIVALQGNTLADALRSYFSNSEQLETELLLAVDEVTAAGLLLQKLPESAQDADSPGEDAWDRVLMLARTLQSQELLQLNCEKLLNRLYHEEQVRVFDAQPLAFACSCSKARTDGLIQGLGLDEAQAILQEQGSISITCEFCDAVYSYETEDVAQLFSAAASVGQGGAHNGEQGGGIKGPTLH